MKIPCGLLLAAVVIATSNAVWAETAANNLKFEVSFIRSLHQQPVTGRLLLMLSRKNEPDVRLQVGWVDSPPVFGLDVDQLKPGQSAAIDASVLGFPLRSLSEIPPGDYYVQALLNVYTQFHRADGHVIWAHMDQWEGQQFNLSPGNLYSEVQKLHVDGARSATIRLTLDKVIPPVQVPVDTEWVKHIKIQSKLLSAFWGHPVYLGAVLLLPRDYGSPVGTRYPVIYVQGHFGNQAPFGFTTENLAEAEWIRHLREKYGTETGYEFYKAWSAKRFPQMIAVTFQHPTQYYDDSYAVNSANNGPYGDAITKELIPYIEEHFRTIREPYARALAGGSTGGWESLALQLQHPDVFGGCWAFYPDPVDFRRWGLVNIYEDANAFSVEEPVGPEMIRTEWSVLERSIERADDGQPIATVRQASQLEAVLGSKGRSGGMIDNWQAIYGPVGADGYPEPIWDKVTGKINHDVADYMRDHGFDLRYFAEKNWPKIGPKLVGKLHLYVGDMDNYYLNLGVYQMEDFLKNTKDPHYDGSVEYGRPMKGHGWTPMTTARLVKTIANHVTKNAPKGADVAWENR